MYCVGWDVNHDPWFCLKRDTIDIAYKRSFKNINPLFVRVRMRTGAGTRSHRRQSEHHAIPLDAGCSSGRVVRTDLEAINLRKVEKVLAGLRSSRTWCFWCRQLGHNRDLRV